MEALLYDSPLWASEGWVILEVANFKEEGLVKDEKEKNQSWKFVGPKGELNPDLLHEMHYTIETLLQDWVD